MSRFKSIGPGAAVAMQTLSMLLFQNPGRASSACLQVALIEERARADSYKLQLEKAEAEKEAIAELADEKVKAAVATALAAEAKARAVEAEARDKESRGGQILLCTPFK